MIQKQLLLKDLCAKQPWGVKVQYNNKAYAIDYISAEYEEVKLDILGNYTVGISDIKPYLRSRSSMTIEEITRYRDLCTWNDVEYYEFGEWTTKIVYNDTWESIDYLNSIHVDYRDLIPMGLALEAPKDMYK